MTRDHGTPLLSAQDVAYGRRMTRRSIRCLAFALALGSAGASGCELYASGLNCAQDRECPDGETCSRGRCVLAEDEDLGPDGGAKDAGGGDDDAGSSDGGGPADDASADDAGSADDGGSGNDAGFDDAGSDDAGGPDDGGPANDAGFDDAGPDPGLDDAGSGDPGPDGGSGDPGLADAGSVGGCVALDGTCNPTAGENQQNCEECRFVDFAVSANVIGELTCGIRADSSLWCWGENDNGRLGVGTTAVAADTTHRDVPTKVTGLSNVRRVSIGDIVCAVDSGGIVSCWGPNEDFELGLGNNVGPETCPFDTPCSDHPVRVPALSNILDVQAGSRTTCVRDGTERVFCWGADDFGNIGAVTTDTCGPLDAPCARTPIDIGLTAESLSLGSASACAARFVNLRDRLFCWGRADHGDLGIVPTEICFSANDPDCSSTPVEVYTNQAPRQVDAFDLGGQGGCLIDGSNVFCWGSGSFNHNGTGTQADVFAPTQIALPGGFVPTDVSVGTFGACVLGTVAGGTTTVLCWGANDHGQLGTGTRGPDDCGGTGCSLTPVEVTPPTGVSFTRVELGNANACGLGDDGLLYCWGADNFGQVGIGSTNGVADVLLPTPVAF